VVREKSGRLKAKGERLKAKVERVGRKRFRGFIGKRSQLKQRI